MNYKNLSVDSVCPLCHRVPYSKLKDIFYIRNNIDKEKAAARSCRTCNTIYFVKATKKIIYIFSDLVKLKPKFNLKKTFDTTLYVKTNNWDIGGGVYIDKYVVHNVQLITKYGIRIYSRVSCIFPQPNNN